MSVDELNRILTDHRGFGLLVWDNLSPKGRKRKTQEAPKNTHTSNSSFEPHITAKAILQGLLYYLDSTDYL